MGNFCCSPPPKPAEEVTSNAGGDAERLPLIPFNKGDVAVHGILCCYNESLEELTTCFRTFKGQSYLKVNLSILMDGHTTAEKRADSPTFAAMKEILGFDESTATDLWGCTVYTGLYDECTSWTLYVKGPDLPRGKRNSHVFFYDKFEGRIADGEIPRPTAMLQVDADTGTANGLYEVERMLDLLLGNPGVAAVSSTTRPANFSNSPVSMMQEVDYTQMKLLFTMQSFFRSVQVCIGQACLYNYELLTTPIYGNCYFPEGSTVVEHYCGAFDKADIMDVVAETIEDAYITTVIQKAGFGTQFSFWTNFDTYVPDTVSDFFGQRRRFITAACITPPYMYAFTRVFLTLRFWRIIFLLPMLAGELQFLFWLPATAVMNLHNVLAWAIYKPYPYPYEMVTPGSAVTGDHYIFWGCWSAILIFMLVVMDHSAGDKSIFLTFCSVACVLLGVCTMGVWIHSQIALLAVDVTLYGMATGWMIPAWANIPFNMFVPIAIVYTVMNFNTPERIPFVWASTILSVFTGNMGTTWVLSMQIPLVIAMSAANADSRAWGTRSVEAPDAAKSTELETRARILWWKKIFLFVFWFGLTFFVSYLQIMVPYQVFHGVSLRNLAWGPYAWITFEVPKEYQFYVTFYMMFTLAVALPLEVVAQALLITYRYYSRKAAETGTTSMWCWLGPLMRLPIHTFPLPMSPTYPTYDVSGMKLGYGYCASAEPKEEETEA